MVTADQADGDRTPEEIVCPRCSAAIGRACMTSTGWRTAPHARRWVAIGIPHPTAADRHRAYQRQRQADMARREALAAAAHRTFRDGVGDRR